MAFSGRPWAVLGSKTPENIARMIAYAATSGGTGVGGPGHLLVTATTPPSNRVLIRPGIAIMRSRYPGVTMETYIDYNDRAFEHPITATGSQGSRTDWLVARVSDPAFPGQQAPPADPLAGPYTFVEALTADPRVSPPAYPFVRMAKITIPKDTATITDAMIDSGPAVREIANPRSAPLTICWNGRVDGSISAKAYPLTNVNGATSSYWLPDSETLGQLRFEVPEWATQLNVQYTLGQVYQLAKDCWGWASVRMCDAANSADYVQLPNVDFDTTKDSAAQWSRESWTGAGNIAIPARFRGKTVVFKPLATRVGGDMSSQFYLGAGSSVSLVGTWFESINDSVV